MMMPQTRDRILAAMSETFGRSNKEIAIAIERSEGNNERSLHELYSMGLVRREVIPCERGNHTYLWYSMGGKPQPLFDDVPGRDAKPLAECWDRYTYDVGGLKWLA